MLSQERPFAVNLPHLSCDKFYQAFLSLNFSGKGWTARGRPGDEATFTALKVVIKIGMKREMYKELKKSMTGPEILL